MRADTSNRSEASIELRPRLLRVGTVGAFPSALDCFNVWSATMARSTAFFLARSRKRSCSISAIAVTGLKCGW